jgi:Zinc carboxypeptidase
MRWGLLGLLLAGSLEALPPHHEILPPALPWSGASRDLALPPDSRDPWVTSSEKSGLTETPTYDETVAWLKGLVAAAPDLDMVSLGKSGEGRDLWMVIASRAKDKSPAAIRASTKPVVFVQAGIHSGEIDGKDAGLMLLRDLTVGGKAGQLLDDITLLFVPILNADGHERRSAFGRINQRGPLTPGWRTTARNLNLNRDYAKLDSPELRAVIGAYNDYEPDLAVDIHVTDGIDYQYDITWGHSGEIAWSPAAARWLTQKLTPPVTIALEAAGHVPGYLVFAIDGDAPDKGLFRWLSASARFSDGYGAARHLPTILVENHSLKPYDQRVLGTYVFLKSLLETVAHEAGSLSQAIAADRSRLPAELTLDWQVDGQSEPEVVDFKGVAFRMEDSAITGAKKVVWLGRPEQKKLPITKVSIPGTRVTRPRAYWIPASWPELIKKIESHGIQVEKLTAPREVALDFYRLGDVEVRAPFEGRVPIKLKNPPTIEKRLQLFPAGSARVSTDQALGDLAMILLEPLSEDSFFAWGMMLEILNRTEYVESYVMEPLAEKMLAADPALKAEFEAKVATDPVFAKDPQARLEFFYLRTPYADDRYRLYPIGREPR